jgi:hypothetical protein
LARCITSPKKNDPLAPGWRRRVARAGRLTALLYDMFFILAKMRRRIMSWVSETKRSKRPIMSVILFIIKFLKLAVIWIVQQRRGHAFLCSRFNFNPPFKKGQCNPETVIFYRPTFIVPRHLLAAKTFADIPAKK